MSTDPDSSGASDPANSPGATNPAGATKPANPAGGANPLSPAAPGQPAAWSPEDPDFEQRVLRAFVRDGRLTSIPARERKKLVVYRYLLDRVLPDPAEIVAERDLNMRLALWHPDVATIRRAFVELQLASRDGMAYHREMPVRS